MDFFGSGVPESPIDFGSALRGHQACTFIVVVSRFEILHGWGAACDAVPENGLSVVSNAVGGLFGDESGCAAV